MRMINRINDSNFGNDSRGRRVFYLLGPLGRGWLLPSQEVEQRIRHRLLGWSFGSSVVLVIAIGSLLLASGVQGSGKQFWGALLCLPLLCAGGMFAHIWPLVAGLARSDERQSTHAFLRTLATALPRPTIWIAMGLSCALLPVFGWVAAASGSPFVREAALLGTVLLAPAPLLLVVLLRQQPPADPPTLRAH